MCVGVLVCGVFLLRAVVSVCVVFEGRSGLGPHPRHREIDREKGGRHSLVRRKASKAAFMSTPQVALAEALLPWCVLCMRCMRCVLCVLCVLSMMSVVTSPFSAIDIDGPLNTISTATATSMVALAVFVIVMLNVTLMCDAHVGTMLALASATGCIGRGGRNERRYERRGR